jgi:hypothetical protein
MTEPPDIDAAELISVRLMHGDGRIRLQMRDQNGHPRTVAIPAQWLDAIVSASPAPPCGGEARPLASWSLDRTNGDDLLLTLRTPEGQAVTFTMKPWQIAGMATIATYGSADPPQKGSLH